MQSPRRTLAILLAAVILPLSTPVFAVDAETTPEAHTVVAKAGAEVGKWTQDYAAAQKLASEKDLPILINFTGSDWCGWCKIMDKTVFSQPAWDTYAAEHLVLATIDFPQDETIVPEPFKARNQTLAEKYKIEGYPTFVVLDSDSATELGRLSAGQDKTPESFAKEVSDLTKYRPSVLKTYLATLEPAVAEDFKTRFAARTAANTEIEAFFATNPPQTEENMATYKALQAKVETAEVSFRDLEVDIRASKLPAADATAYRAAYASLKTKTDELVAWLKTKPAKTPENTTVYNTFMDELTKCQMTVDKFE